MLSMQFIKYHELWRRVNNNANAYPTGLRSRDWGEILRQMGSTRRFIFLIDFLILSFFPLNCFSSRFHFLCYSCVVALLSEKQEKLTLREIKVSYHFFSIEVEM